MLSALVLSGTSFAFGKDRQKVFTDLKAGHWAHDSVIKMSQIGIISGYPDGSFKPGKLVTYGEFIKMAAIAGNAAVSDLKAEDGQHWGTPYYEAGLNNSYFSQWDISKAALDIPIPRKHMALIASGIMDEDVKISDYGDYGKIEGSISDVDEKTPFEYDIVKAYAVGVLSGYPDGTFRPEGVLSRAEAASVIDRLLKVVNKEQTAEDPEPVVVNPELEQEPIKSWVEVNADPLGSPDGSFALIIREYGKDLDAQHQELLSQLKILLPNEADAILKEAITLGRKPYKERKNSNTRKQYFGEYPVLIDHIFDTIYIDILPKGYWDEYWGIRPGQVEEF